MNISVRKYIRDEVIRNLLSAHKRIAEEGNVRDLVYLSRFILKISKQIDNEIFDFRLENTSDGTEKPP